MESLSEKKLAKALKDNKAYKDTQPFLDAINGEQSQGLAPIFSSVIMGAFNSEKVALMTKLLAMRLYKDIFIVGNMDFFDSLDSEIQDSIFTAAAYNPTFKTKGKNDKETRGGNFFVQTEGRSKDQQTTQIGNSFVLFATEIIKYFAKWHPSNQDNTSSRFLDAYEELESLGVSFATKIYFQPEQEAAFHKNYQSWLQKKKKQNPQPSKEQKIAEEKPKTKKKFMDTVPDQQLQAESGKKKKEGLQDNIKSQQKNHQQQVASVAPQQSEKQHCGQELKLIQQLKQKQLQISQFKEKITQLEHALAEKSASIKQMQQQEQRRVQEQRKVNNSKSVQGQQIGRIKKQCEKNKMLKEEAFLKIGSLEKQMLEVNKQSENLKAEVKKNKAQIERLKEQLQSHVVEYEDHRNNKQELKKQNDRLLLENQQLQNNIEKMNITIQQQTSKLQKKYQEEVEYAKCELPIQNALQNMKEASREIQEETQCLARVSHSNEKQLHAERKSVEDKMSLSTFLGLKAPDQAHFCKTTTNSVYSPFYQEVGFPRKNKSMKKTENSKSKQSTHISNQTMQFQPMKDKMNMMFSKTENNFLKKVPCNSYKKLAHSVFPFIPEYFEPMNVKESVHFRACCLSERPKPFFLDGEIEIKLMKSDWKNYHISFKNKSSDSMKVEINSQTIEVRVKSHCSSQKIPAFSEATFPIEGDVTNLNFRFPIFSLRVYKLGEEIVYRMPVPITLFSYSKMDHSRLLMQKWADKINNNFRRYKSETFSMHDKCRNLPNIFPQLNFQDRGNGDLEAESILTYPLIPEIKAKLTLVQICQHCEIEIQFDGLSKINEAYAKVILQVLMFLLY